MSGLVHLYCADGKGKTTAAMGLAVRCAGWQERVLVVQLMKQDNSGERRILEQLPQVTLWETYPDAKFSFRMTLAEKAEAAHWYTGQFRRITEAVHGGTYRMLILDELLSCISCGFLPEETVLAFLDSRPENLEVVMTGRNPSPALAERADYLTEMCLRKHPYEEGISARKGIEY